MGLEVTIAMGSYSHFNEFKRLHSADGEPLGTHLPSDIRQAVVDELPPPRSAHDIMDRLSLHKGEKGVVFQPHATILTTVLNGTTGRMNVWCATPSAETSPVYSWDLNSFFMNDVNTQDEMLTQQAPRHV